MSATRGQRPELSRCTRVLVVDEHALSRKVVALMLKMSGHETLAVASVADALDSIVTFGPDVVVLEWVFRRAPEIGRGLAATMRARSAELGRALNVIVASHADQPPTFLDEEEVDAYLTKPVAPQVLLLAIATSLKARTAS